MVLTSFDPPGNLDDYNTILNQLEAWSEYINEVFTSAVRENEGVLSQGKSQFYNPLGPSMFDASEDATIAWPAFPKILSEDSMLTWRQAMATADKRPAPGESRIHDEYLEWFVEYDEESNKIKRVIFTCEGPEYWQAMAHGHPFSSTNWKTNALGDKTKVLELYRQYVSPNVQHDDLFPEGQYDPLNKWNTSHGAMHLTHPANTLSAEINLAADATILRKNGEGAIISDQNELIRCAGYGIEKRASDPLIGGEVNALARQGALITLKNPVGLYMSEPNTSGWTSPDNSDPLDYWKVVRGGPGLAVRAVYEVPSNKEFLVGDIEIGGRPIEFGGQIAEHLFVRLIGSYSRLGGEASEAQTCTNQGMTSQMIAESDMGDETVEILRNRRSGINGRWVGRTITGYQ
ncbi:hypothetical protein KQI74_06665 [Paenibacillus barcinonensis]|uniref:hypothetical protein n=1 Tax=Paenibacillus barcinonensis TaxID=198119 RepID=UPI001C10D668|nr:hypothetical protein [Paenibacillus barcinonensis]MBU5351953.1 hypothetical protein [Paenibacillus barcinonensis]